MKFSTIFLTAAALAQNQITVTRQDGSSNPVDATPGVCRGLGGAPINRVSVPPGLVVQFFNEDSCRGSQVAFGIRDQFVPTGNPNNIKSIRVLNERGPSPNDASYYHNSGNYYQGFPFDDWYYYNSRNDRSNSMNNPDYYKINFGKLGSLSGRN